MADSEREETPLAERVVKEAVTKGMDSPMRETIVEAVEEAEGEQPNARRIPVVGALLGIGAAFGYLLGVRSKELIESEDVSLDSVEEPDVIEDITSESDESGTEGIEEIGAETGEAGEETESKSRLPRILLGLGAIAAVALARRRLMGGEEEEWEPIEEFAEDEGAEEEAEAEDESEEAETGEDEEAEAEAEDETDEEAEE